MVTDLTNTPFRPDVIHGHHHVPTTEAAVRFGDAPVVYVCHDRLHAHDIPPILPTIHRYVAVDANCRERLLVDAGIDPSRVSLVHNAVDLDRFRARPPLPNAPRSAAVFSNQARPGGYLDIVIEACRYAGLEVQVIGSGVGRVEVHPERELAKIDLVFAKARCALEALAVGCAVILLDAPGLGRMVTSPDVAWQREWNFGARTLQVVPTLQSVLREIERYDASDASRVSSWVRDRCGLDLAVDTWEQIYQDSITDSTGQLRTHWVDSVRSLAEHVGHLEVLVRAVHTGPAAVPMMRPPLPPSIGEAVVLSIVECEREAELSTGIRVEVDIDNRSNETMISVGLTPVQIGYHWIDADTGAVLLWDGDRTQLPRPIYPGDRIRLSMQIRTPDLPGMFHLVISLVQEHVFWFDQLPGAVVQRSTVRVRASDLPVGLVRLSLLASDLGLSVLRDATIGNLGFLSGVVPNMLSFAESVSFVRKAISAQAAALIVPASLADQVPDHVGVLVHEAPREVFVRIHEWLVEQTNFYGSDTATSVDVTARVHPTSWVDSSNVVIGAGCIIGPNVTITGRVVLGERVCIHAGAIVGAQGFQTAPSNIESIEVTHAGGIRIGTGTQVFSGAVIARGVFRGDTTIGERCRIGNNAFVSHHCRIGSDTHVGHGAVVNGNVVTGLGTWIGPGSTIANNVVLGDRARISLGATVAGDVGTDQHVTGSIAVDHWSMMRATAALRRRGPASR